MTSSLSSGRWIRRVLVAAFLAVRRRPGGEVYMLNTRPQPSQIRRPVRRLNRMLEIEIQEHHRLERLPELRQHFFERLGLRDVARKAVENEAIGGIRLASRSRIMPSTVASSTSLPASMAALARARVRCPWLTASRNRSPVDICGTP